MQLSTGRVAAARDRVWNRVDKGPSYPLMYFAALEKLPAATENT
jgi:hypothetical protein